MQEYRIGQKLNDRLTPVIVNKYNDKIYIDINDTTFVNKVIDLYQWFGKVRNEITKISDDYDKSVAKFNIGETEGDEELPMEVLELYKQYNSKIIQLYMEICEQFDIIFGEGTIHKYFREFYEAFGDSFIPDDECINDFIDEITPVLEELFEKRKGSLKSKYVKKSKQEKSSVQMIAERRHAIMARRSTQGDDNV